MNVEATLQERQTIHGNFKENAECSQALKFTCRQHVAVALTRVQQEAIENICQKLARILTGNPNHPDNWHDIAGYARLAEQDIKLVERETEHVRS